MQWLYLYKSVFALFAVSLLLLTGVPVVANDWQATLYDIALPQHVVTVDKTAQMLYLYEKRSPVTLKFTYPCTTGQIDGDKQAVNDMRTPEGIYFVDYKITNGLDFKEYGGIAYTLNYPNPVDRLRGKTGHGIWIHSKGFGIAPRETRGCIAIGLREIEEIGPLLQPGTPVVVAEKFPPGAVSLQHNETARHLRSRMDQWTRAWAGRSTKMFDFYDAEAYTKAMPETFAAYRANKERLFKFLEWINIFNREVHVLEGPGYWVTWSEQFYRAPNLSVEGIRRLYWQKSADAHFRIVGMEWLPRNLGLHTAYRKGQLVAATEAPVSDATAEAPVPPPLTMPERAMPDAGTVALSPPSVPVAPAVPRLDAATVALLKQRMEAWADAWQSHSPDFFAFYDETRYGQQRDIPLRDSMTALKADMTRRFRAPWITVFQRPVTVSIEGNYHITSAEQLIREPGRTPVQGIRRLYWLPDAQGTFRIVGMQWTPGEHALLADYLEAITVPVGQSIEAWRTAWEAGALDTYMDFYAPGAHQQGRGRESMREQKARLWATNPPAEVRLQGIRIQVTSWGVRVDMAQTYRDKEGRGDKGTKTLLLQPPNTPHGSWRIIQEDWTSDMPAPRPVTEQEIP